VDTTLSQKVHVWIAITNIHEQSLTITGTNFIEKISNQRSFIFIHQIYLHYISQQFVIIVKASFCA